MDGEQMHITSWSSCRMKICLFISMHDAGKTCSMSNMLGTNRVVRLFE